MKKVTLLESKNKTIKGYKSPLYGGHIIILFTDDTFCTLIAVDDEMGDTLDIAESDLNEINISDKEHITANELDTDWDALS